MLDLNRGTSLVNFCETDIITNRFVEHYNTYSSLAIVFFSLLGIIKVLSNNELTDTLKKNQDISINNETILDSKKQRYILNLILFQVGMGSLFFHSELSVFAHWVDIILISIILLVAEYYIDSINRKKKSVRLRYLIFFLLHLLSSILIPSFHIFIQYLTGFLIVKKINILMNKIKDKGEDNYDIMMIYNKIEKEYIDTKVIFGISLLLWVIDYFCCFMIKPYHTHWLFHIGIGLTAYKIIDLFKYLWLINYNDIIENRV
jgi:hypothetical protein